MPAARGIGENFAAVLRHADTVFELRRKRPVARHGRPAVGQHFDMRLAEIDHRLDGKQHSGLQHRAFAGIAVMENVGAVVENQTEPVPAKIADHAAPFGLGIGLDRIADMADRIARLDDGNPPHEGLVGDIDQPFGLTRNRADRVHPAGIAMPAIDDDGNVDIDDVAVAQTAGGRECRGRRRG